MTGYASGEGQLDGYSWTWDLRAVNNRGFDLRLRVPDWIDGLEAALRPMVQKAAARGSITLSLKLAREAADTGVSLNAEALDWAVDLVRQVENRASELHLGLTPSRATDILSMRGVLDASAAGQDTSALKAALLAEIPPLLDAFNASRQQEGAALAEILSAQVDTIEELVGAARGMVEARADKMKASLAEALTRVAEATDVEPGRIAQELALIAVKADVAEELDRLDAHIATARDLLTAEEPKGRKLDFLTQEFNREANTLCSKAQFKDLTRIGLDLKHTIDQMREQVQNVE